MSIALTKIIFISGITSLKTNYLILSFNLQARHVQKVRRKRWLERELFHQYSYPNSEADDMEEQNIGDIESVINAQFVSFSSDRSDKNLYEDSSEVRFQ